jgi:hypothetical protein
MKTALFFNWTNKPFTGYWDGKPKTIKAGQKEYMPEYLARHFAKHLTNFVLIEKGMDNYTSPKFPEQVPAFMDLFNKAFILEDDAAEQDEAQLATDLANKRHDQREATLNIPSSPAKTVVDNKPPQIVTGPDAGDDDENNYEGLQGEKPE